MRGNAGAAMNAGNSTSVVTARLVSGKLKASGDA